MWIARDKNQDIMLYEEKPVREFDVWTGFASDYMKISDTTLFPNLKWEDEPIEVNLIEVELVPKGKSNKTDITVTRENIIFNDSYWTALRNTTAMAAMASMLEKWNNISEPSVLEEVCELSVTCADALIKRLKSKEENVGSERQK